MYVVYWDQCKKEKFHPPRSCRLSPEVLLLETSFTPVKYFQEFSCLCSYSLADLAL